MPHELVAAAAASAEYVHVMAIDVDTGGEMQRLQRALLTGDFGQVLEVGRGFEGDIGRVAPLAERSRIQWLAWRRLHGSLGRNGFLT